MAKYSIDDILNELGIDETKGKSKPKLMRGHTEQRTHVVDQSSDSFSPLPSMPAHQGKRGKDARNVVEHDPAIKNAFTEAPTSAVGESINQVYDPADEQALAVHSELAEMLLESGAATHEQISSAQQIIRQTPGQDLAGVVIEQGAEAAEVQRVVAENAGLPFERINIEAGLDGGFDGKLLQRLGVDFAKENEVLPLRTEGNRVVVGATSADDVFMIDEMRRKLGAPSVKVVIVTAEDIRAAIELVDDGAEQEVDLSDILADVDEDDIEVETITTDNTVDLEQQAGESPVIRYVNYIIQTAVKEGASDIHVEPSDKHLKIRFRIDGVLFEMMNPPGGMAAAITSRLKIMANLDISERRIPQDGRIRCTVQGRKLDLRVSTLPTPTGEKTVMRILDTKSINVELEELGFEPQTLETWKRQIQSPNGIVLVTGPTGSGKTTTLYSSIRQLDKKRLNVSTVEDPVEYHLDGITQTQTHEKIGMTFAAALRALLRQDPDVIMIGEIRDHETAHIAVQAALTGHLVLSTLHTNDAPASITRLVNIGIEPFLVGAAVNSVLAQRLVRRLCQHCKVEDQPTDEMTEYLQMQGFGTTKTYAAKGCERCRGTGFSGRVGIYEMLVIDDQLRDVVARNPNVAEFRRLCLERGMTPLREDGLKKVRTGMTTVQEILRVTEANF